ncbi:MAG: hypothetical protein H7122_16805 [Chitinophagaceae bacterium]|nr:hypothetical protein [Chitinophagaceae bacterium]
MRQRFLLLSSILFMFIACKKTQEYSCQNCGKADGKLLSKVVYPDPFISGLYNVQAFYYDQSKRCIKIETGIIDSNATAPSFSVNISYTFYYTGINKNPAYMERRTPNSFPNVPRPFYFQFDNQGKKLKDSVRIAISQNQFSERVIHINRSGNKIITTPQYVNLSMDNSNFDTLIIGNNNINLIRSKIFKQAGNHDYQVAEYSYDNSINPFNKINISESFLFTNSSVGYGFLGPGLTRYIGFSENNCSGYSLNGVIQTSIQYSYDQDQYPSIAVATYQGTSYKQVAFFEYYP